MAEDRLLLGAEYDARSGYGSEVVGGKRNGPGSAGDWPLPAKRATKSRASEITPVAPHGLSTTTPPWGDREQNAPQLAYQSTSPVQAAEPQAEATLPPASAEPSAAAGPSTASWGEHQNSTPQRFQSASATAKDISRLPELDSLPVDHVKVVLPRLMSFVKEFERPVCGNPASHHC